MRMIFQVRNIQVNWKKLKCQIKVISMKFQIKVAKNCNNLVYSEQRKKEKPLWI